MQQTEKIQRDPDVVARELGGSEGGVLLHLQTGAYHGMNSVGMLVWELIDGERTVADLTAAMRQRVPESPPELADDIVRFLERALERGLVHTIP